MRKNKLLAVLLLWLILTAAFPFRTAGAGVTYTVAQVDSLCDGIVAYNGANSAQDFIDGALCRGAGTTAEFYAIALSQSGNYRFDRYESALLSYLSAHEVYSATSREKYALALSAAGSTDRYITDTADEAIGELGIMSLVFGLHLLNNGYESAAYSTDGLIDEILSYRMNDGGWAVMGSYGDVDVTAMALQALAPYYGRRGDVGTAIDNALSLLSKKQLDSGGFKTMGAENCESAAQVIIALSALGIDAQTDGRFIKNGNSAMTGMMQFDLGNGSFAHTGSAANATATEEAFCALTAYARFCRGQSGLYLLDHTVHAAPSDNGDDPAQENGGSPNSNNQKGNQQNDGGQNGVSGGSSAGQRTDSDSQDDLAERVETDADGNRIIIINGQRFIEATTASGEKVTVNINETTAAQPDTAADRTTHGSFQPAATADSSVSATADETGAPGSYKPYAVLGVILAAGAASGVLFVLKKRNKKHYIAVAAIAAAGILFLLLTDFKSPDSYHQPAKTDGDLKVTLSIRCDTIVGREKVNDFIPDDGVILETTTFTADEGDTVYDILMQAAREKDIPIDNRGADGAAYIAGINNLYEFDYGYLSGWMYRVNGAFPEVGCQSYTVSDGDTIEWLYTMSVGRDLD